MAYPANVTFKHQDKSSRLWALLTIIPIKMIALIPHFFVLYLLQIVAGILAIAGILVTLFTGKYPKSIENIVVGLFRWIWRVNAYFMCLTDKYPPFALKAGDYPADLSFAHEKTSSRLWALLTIIPVKMILLIPHIIVLFVLQLIAGVCMLLGLFVTLFAGKYPKSFESVIVTAMRYQFRLNAYIMCLTDKYPPVHWDE
jgi:Domain of unknown function (DUF4389)